MSSTVFSTELKPEASLRCAVQFIAILATILGLVIVVTLPFRMHWLMIAALIWLVVSVRELRLFRRAYSRFCQIRLDGSGEVEILTNAGDWQSATLLAGSVVLPCLAWLRIETRDGLRYAELMRGNCRKNEEWRRLQVVWRHFGAAS